MIARCPFPICGDDGTVAMCIANGHCGCDERTAPGEFHDDKPSERACSMAVTTQDGDLDPFGRPLRQGS